MNSKKYKDYKYILIYTWRTGSRLMDFDSIDIPCVDKKQVSDETLRCMEYPAFLRVEVCFNEAYERPQIHKWNEIKKKLSPERQEKIDEAVKKELEVISSEKDFMFSLKELPSQSSEYWTSRKG